MGSIEKDTPVAQHTAALQVSSDHSYSEPAHSSTSSGVVIKPPFIDANETDASGLNFSDAMEFYSLCEPQNFFIEFNESTTAAFYDSDSMELYSPKELKELFFDIDELDFSAFTTPDSVDLPSPLSNRYVSYQNLSRPDQQIPNYDSGTSMWAEMSGRARTTGTPEAEETARVAGTAKTPEAEEAPPGTGSRNIHMDPSTAGAHTSLYSQPTTQGFEN